MDPVTELKRVLYVNKLMIITGAKLDLTKVCKTCLSENICKDYNNLCTCDHLQCMFCDMKCHRPTSELCKFQCECDHTVLHDCSYKKEISTVPVNNQINCSCTCHKECTMNDMETAKKVVIYLLNKAYKNNFSTFLKFNSYINFNNTFITNPYGTQIYVLMNENKSIEIENLFPLINKIYDTENLKKIMLKTESISVIDYLIKRKININEDLYTKRPFDLKDVTCTKLFCVIYNYLSDSDNKSNFDNITKIISYLVCKQSKIFNEQLICLSKITEFNENHKRLLKYLLNNTYINILNITRSIDKNLITLYRSKLWEVLIELK